MARTYGNTPFLSKIKINIDGQYHYLKDADARALLDSINDNIWEKLQLDVGQMVTDNAGLVTGGAAKAYVDAKIAEFKPFEAIICPADATKIPAGAIYSDGTTRIVGTMPATEDTCGKLYLVLGESATESNIYSEWISTRHTDGTYSWELIGSTAIDIKNCLTIDSAVAGVTFGADKEITKAELETALELKDFAHADEATATIPSYTLSNITGATTAAGSIEVTLDQTSTAITSTGTFTPAGSITGSAISDGTVAVTLKDAATATAISSTGTFTPNGNITTDSTVSALTSAVLAKDNTGIQISGTVSKPAITINSSAQAVITGVTTEAELPSFTEGAFTPAAINDGFFSSGNVNFGTFNGGSLPTLSAATTGNFATTGFVAAYGESDDDAECLILTPATLASAVTAQGTLTGGAAATWTGASYTAPSIDTTKFSGGSKAADTFNAGAAAEFATGSVANVTSAELATTPVFTGDKFKVTTEADDALKSVSFEGTSGNVTVSGSYKKQEINTATFTGTAATLGFSGTAGNVSVAGNYNEASVKTATFTGAQSTVAVNNITHPAQTITVTPDLD